MRVGAQGASAQSMCCSNIVPIRIQVHAGTKIRVFGTLQSSNGAVVEVHSTGTCGANGWVVSGLVPDSLTIL